MSHRSSSDSNGIWAGRGVAMPHVRNAFKIRAADAPIIETSQFLQLYCPLLLEHLEHDDLFVPKLIVVRRQPWRRQVQSSAPVRDGYAPEQFMAGERKQVMKGLVDRLETLGILSDAGPKVVGIYIQCDSSLRDIANLPQEQATLRSLQHVA